MADDISRRRSIMVVLVLLLGIAALILMDVLTDYRAGTSTSHLLVETLVLTLAVMGAALLWRQFGSARAAARDLERDLVAVEREASRWRGEAMDLLLGLRSEIERQFSRWGLTPAERAIAMMLLRGLSHKEVAAARQTAERTVREQARSIYEKAGLAGRAELSAFFLDGMLLPVDPQDPGAVP